MTGVNSNAELKAKLLELLESDAEFRYAVAAKIGLLEILERLDRHEERMVKLEERMLKLEEQMVSLQEQVRGLWEELRETRRLVMVVAHRFGVLSEEAFRDAVRYVVEEVLGVAKVARLVLHDSEGLVYGYETEVDIDVVVKD